MPEVAVVAPQTERKPNKVDRPIRYYGDWLVIALMLTVGLAGAWLPVGWTRDYKRPAQTPFYWQLALAYVAVYGGATWWVWRGDEAIYRRRGWLLIPLIVLPNALNIWLRYGSELKPGQPLFGRDGDIGLYFKYAHDFATGLPPTFQNHPMEYPQGALLLFWLGERLARGKLETFYWVFPALMLLFQLGAGLALFGIGRKVGRARAGFLLTAFVAGSPFLLSFHYTRFDMAPTAFLIVGIYFFLPGAGQEGFRLPGRRGGVWSGLAVSLGFLTKWLPAVVAPFLALAYWQAHRRREGLGFGLALAGLSLVGLLPFYLADSIAFWYPYQWQSSRRLMGESFWYLVQYHLLDPAKTEAARPWSEPDVILLTNTLLQVLQLGLLAVVFGLALWGLRKVQRLTEVFDGWAACGLIGVVVFTLSNRVYSPQFMILIMWALAVVIILKVKNWREVAVLLAGLTVMSLANFLVFYLGAFAEQWIPLSGLFFSLGWLTTGWLVWGASQTRAK